MKRIGLTGGIGSGKSTVAEIFHHFGVPVFNSDNAARKLQDEDEQVKKQITGIFGNEIYDEGKLNRKKVAEIVFKDSKKLEALNSIVHPAVAKAFEKFCEENKSAKYILKEAAILFEIGADKVLDGMIVVTAPDELRLERVSKRDGISKEQILLRMNSQLSQEEKIKKADFVIVNDGKEMLIPQVVKVDQQLRN
jgi:dephospho-CoA kinase